jgi:hypothetical protein
MMGARALILLKAEHWPRECLKQAEGGVARPLKTRRKVAPKTRMNHFLSKMTNFTKGVGFVIQLTIPSPKLAQYFPM